MKTKSITVLIVLSAFIAFCALASCKKHCPVPDQKNSYQMNIEITDNAPFGNVYGLFAIAENDFEDSTNFTNAEGENYLFLDKTPVYLERTIFLTETPEIPVFIWAITSGSVDNFYSVEVLKNGLSVFKAAGYILNFEKIQI